MEIPIKGECYAINSQIVFPDDGSTDVDFGTVPVCQSASKSLRLRNDGKHATMFRIERLAELNARLSIRPETGTVNPEEDIELEVHL